MPKSLFIDPKNVRRSGIIRFNDIPVLTYHKSIADEKNNFTKKEFLNIYRDMSYIREFETMLKMIKTTGEYKTMRYTHPGAAHYAIGEEPANVGMAYHLSLDDAIFGTHRSHGELLAKGLRSIEQLTDDQLMDIMQNYFGGTILKVVDGKQSSVKELARDYLLYGSIAEIFGRVTGFNKGLCGSMHAFFTPFGVFPNNAVVGASVPIATGAALFKKINKKSGIIVCNTGDGSLARGPVWEGLMLAAMDQYRVLWDEEHKGGLPLLINCVNNQYGMGGQTSGETMGFNMPARIGAGVNPEQMYSERIDGFNVLAVIDAFKRKKQLLLEKKGPILLDTVTYRFEVHSPSDYDAYRTQEEIEAWKAVDGLETYRKELIKARIASETDLEAIREKTAEQVLKAGSLSIDDNVSPRMDFVKNPDVLAELMFSEGIVKSFDPDRKPEVLIPKEQNSRIKQIRKKERFISGEGQKGEIYSVRDGLFEPILDKFYEDPTFVAFAEEIREWDGVHGVTRGLTSALPFHRLFNAPIAETAIVSGALGYAMSGGRVMVELMYGDFIGCVGDELFNQLAKWQAMSAGVLKLPVLLRVPIGYKYGAQHEQDFSALVAHVPGLKVVFPATPADAKGLMTTALDSTDPVVFFEAQRIYDMGEIFHAGGVPEGRYEIPFGEPDIKKMGRDLTILTIGPTLYRAWDAIKILEEKYGLCVELIDARSIVPFNYEPVLDSIKKTRRILIAGDSVERGSVMRHMASMVTDLAFKYLDAPVAVVGSRNSLTPAHELEKYVLPQTDTIIDTIHERIMPLSGHICTYNVSLEESLKRSKHGI